MLQFHYVQGAWWDHFLLHSRVRQVSFGGSISKSSSSVCFHSLEGSIDKVHVEVFETSGAKCFMLLVMNWVPLCTSEMMLLRKIFVSKRKADVPVRCRVSFSVGHAHVISVMDLFLMGSTHQDGIG